MNKDLINVVFGDITKVKADAIVNAANNSLLGGGGVDGAIHKAAGPRLKEECKTLKGCDTGQSKITGGYNLPCKYVIHTVGPVYKPKLEEKQLKQLASCYTTSLNLARKYNLHTIVFPSISTGFYGFPHDIASETAFISVLTWLQKNSDYEMKVTFCCYDQFTFNLYIKKFQSIMNVSQS